MSASLDIIQEYTQAAKDAAATAEAKSTFTLLAQLTALTEEVESATVLTDHITPVVSPEVAEWRSAAKTIANLEEAALQAETEDELAKQSTNNPGLFNSAQAKADDEAETTKTFSL